MTLLTPEEHRVIGGGLSAAVLLLKGADLAVTAAECAHVLVVAVNKQRAICCVCRAERPAQDSGLVIKAPEL